MNKQFKFIGVFILTVGVSIMSSCKKDISPGQDVSFEEVLSSGGEFDSFSNHKILTNISTSSVPVDSGNWN